MSATPSALERFLFGMAAVMTLQMLWSSEDTVTGRAFDYTIFAVNMGVSFNLRESCSFWN